MKKTGFLILAFVAVLMLAACAGEGASAKTGNQTAGVNDVLEAGMAKKDNQNTETEENVEEVFENNSEERQAGINKGAPEPEVNYETENTVVNSDGIDVDLTALSSTMVYSEVYNMLLTPDDYIGKTVKMEGTFSAYHDEETGNDYFSCIISDATACCAQGIEFVLKDGYNYPDDYPVEGETVCVVGTFDTYDEGMYTFCTLRNAELA